MFSASSVFNAVAAYTLMAGAVCAMRRRPVFLKTDGVSVLLLLSAIAAVRLLMPIEIPVTATIPLWNLLGAPQRFINDHPFLTQFLSVVWAVGAVLVTGRDILVLYFAHKRCRAFRRVESRQVQEIADRLGLSCPVVVSPDVEAPFVAGFVRPVVYFPSGELRGRYIELILAHEQQHIRSHDALIKLFFGIVSALLWWNPVAHMFRKEINVLLEMRCDAKVTKGMSEDERTEYLDMLTEMTKRAAQGRRAGAMVLDESSAAGRKTVMEQRFTVMGLKMNLAKRLLGVLFRLVIVAVFVGSYLVIFQPASLPLPEEFEEAPGVTYHEKYDGPAGEDEINLTFIVKGSDGRYQLFVNCEFSRYLSDREVFSEEYQHLFIFEEGAEK